MMNQVVELPTPARRRADAQALMHKAWAEKSMIKRVGLAKEALIHDPNCIDALTILIPQAQLDPQVDPIDALSEAVESEARELRDQGLFDAHQGAFWSQARTRVFLRALAVLVRLYARAEQWALARDACERIIALDQRDTQGHRYALANLMLRAGDYEGFHALDAQFNHENSVMFLFNRALVSYIETGRGASSRAMAKRALVFNPMVPRYLAQGAKPAMPEQQSMSPEVLAWLYAKENYLLWNRTPGALRWLTSILTEMRAQ